MKPIVIAILALFLILWSIVGITVAIGGWMSARSYRNALPPDRVETGLQVLLFGSSSFCLAVAIILLHDLSI